MKEQVITPRMSARGAAAGKGRSGGAIVQKPARRDRAQGSSSGRAHAGHLRKVLSYLPLFGKIALAVFVGVLLFAGYRSAASASFFQARIVDINPTTRASADDIARVVRHAAAQTGVWNLKLEAVSEELERLPWIRTAIVSRVLPDGLRVRVTERTPLAVVRTSSGKFVWVDEDAVSLGAMSPADRQPAFFIYGWTEKETPEARAENRERIQKYSELVREWDAAGLSERVSEVNLADVRDVRAQLTGDDSAIEVRLGSKDFGNRLQRALKVLDSERQKPRGPFITRIEALMDNRTIIGFGTETQASSDSPVDNSASAETNGSAPAKGEPVAANASRRIKKATDETRKKDKEQRSKKEEAKKEKDRKEEAKTKAKGDTRPRRVG